ncbi:hypothetical protein ACJX0J_023401, partial [Zea mays]
NKYFMLQGLGISVAWADWDIAFLFYNRHANNFMFIHKTRDTFNLYAPTSPLNKY